MTNEKLVLLLAEAFDAESDESVEYENTAQVLRFYNKAIDADDAEPEDIMETLLVHDLTAQQWREQASSCVISSST